MYVAGTSALEHMRASGPLGQMAAPKRAPGLLPVRSITRRFDGKGEEDAVRLDPWGIQATCVRRLLMPPLPFHRPMQPLYPQIQAGPSVGGEDEAAKIAAMFQAEADQWQQTQETMATCVPARIFLPVTVS
jgi:hypothetical protein